MRHKDDRKPLRMVILITQLGINMLVPIFICAWLGVKAVGIFHMDILFPCFLLLGILAGFRTCYMTIRRFVPVGDTASHDFSEKAGSVSQEADFEENGESDEYEMDKMDKGDQ